MSNECMSLPPLKPCPFCGGKARLLFKPIMDSELWVCECDDCFAKTYHEDTQREAVEAWNRRAGESNGDS